MAKKKIDVPAEEVAAPVEEVAAPAEEIFKDPELEKIESEMRAISPTLFALKRENPLKYREVYRRFMWLVAERDKLKP